MYIFYLICLLIFISLYIFFWLVLKKRPLTVDNFVKRGWTGDTLCVLCMAHDEPVDHLFTQCVFTKFIMVMGVEGVQGGELGDDVHQVWRGGRPENEGITGVTASQSWLLAGGLFGRSEMTSSIFRNILPDLILAIERIMQLLLSWKINPPPTALDHT